MAKRSGKHYSNKPKPASQQEQPAKTKQDKPAEGQKQNIKSDKFEFNFKNKKFIASIPFGLAVLIWAMIWIIPAGGEVLDPWYEAIKLIDSSNKVDDPASKSNLLNEAGFELKHQAKEYPFHARVHFFLGYYYFVVRQWDSSIAEMKMASHIDSGSTINSVWPDAHDILVKASVNKSLPLINNKNYPEAKKILLDAYPYYPNSPLLNKFLGSVYYDTGEFEEAQRHLMISFSGDPKDAEVANLIGVIYKMKGDLNNASAYFRKALELNPNLQAAKANLQSLNN